MSPLLDILMLALVCTSLMLLGSSRLPACINRVAMQGALLGFLPLVSVAGRPTLRLLFLAVATLALRGLGFPWLLRRAMREVKVQREVEPLVSFNISLVAGMAALATALWLSTRLPLPRTVISSLLVPVSFFTIFCGLFLIVARRKALTQVIGYLVLENGIYIFGIAFTHHMPLVFELGVLLDVFVAVFVMGIMVFHIQREFDHIDIHRLSALKDWQP